MASKAPTPGSDRTFTGFGLAVRDWFTGLEADNSREYFTAHRAFFEESVRGQMEALLATLADRHGGQIKLFRPNRDIRFSADKSPYKTHTYGILSGSHLAASGLYASISADGLVAGGGHYMMARDQLERFRAAVAAEPGGVELEGLLAAAEASGLEPWGESLATAPRGYPKDHPRIGLLRRKALALGATLDFGRRGISGPDGLAFMVATWRSAGPVIRWLDEHVGETTEVEAQRR
jgi:uncharacterized protein (TIGR02453 family)